MKVVVEHNKLPRFASEMPKIVDRVLGDGAAEMVGTAQRIVPVDTGRLRASITFHRVGNLIYEVFTIVEYGPHVEYGTRYMAAQPFLRPSYERNYKQIIANLTKELARI